MDIPEWINSVKPIVIKNIYTSVNEVFEEFNSSGLLQSGITLDKSINMGFQVIKSEVLDIVKKLSTLRLRKCDIEKLRKECISFIETESFSLLEYCLRKTDNTNDQYTTFELKHQIFNKSVVALVEFEISLLMQSYYDRIWKVTWEVIRIVMGAVIGGLITWFIKIKSGQQ